MNWIFRLWDKISLWVQIHIVKKVHKPQENIKIKPINPIIRPAVIYTPPKFYNVNSKPLKQEESEIILNSHISTLPDSKTDLINNIENNITSDFFEKASNFVDKNSLTLSKKIKFKNIFPQQLLAITHLKESSDAFNNWRLANNFSPILIMDEDFSFRELSHVNWKNCCLVKINFENANLVNSSFTNSILYQVNFENANLIESDFSDVDLSNCSGFDSNTVKKIKTKTINVWLMPKLSIFVNESIKKNSEIIEVEEYSRILLFCLDAKKKSEIAEFLKFKKNKAFYKMIDDLLNKDLLQLTIPDKPKIKNQKLFTSQKGRDLLEIQNKLVNSKNI